MAPPWAQPSLISSILKISPLSSLTHRPKDGTVLPLALLLCPDADAWICSGLAPALLSLTLAFVA